MASHKCAFCGQVFKLIEDTTFKSRLVKFSYDHDEFGFYNHSTDSDRLGACYVLYYKCPNEECNRISICIQSNDDYLPKFTKWIHPDYIVESLPNYVPEQIRNDYEEACKILELSPKASATLSRRVLQGMIRDYWRISKKTLHQEIEALKDHISEEEFNSLMSLKSLGNIGAHPEADISLIIDVSPEEANQLIELIKLFIEDWYTKRYNKQQRLQKVNEIGNAKNSLKNGNQPDHE